jgi:hypothetical protein
LAGAAVLPRCVAAWGEGSQSGPEGLPGAGALRGGGVRVVEDRLLLKAQAGREEQVLGGGFELEDGLGVARGLPALDD